MPTALRLIDYVRQAFSARPIGMFVPPNWIALAGMGLLGLINPGFWLLGAGLEIGYLFFLCSNARFRFYVGASHASRSRRDWQTRLETLISQLSGRDQEACRALQARCATILQQQGVEGSPAGLMAQSQGLGKLLWIYLRLLLTRQAILRVLSESDGRNKDRLSLGERIGDLEGRLARENLSEELHKSLAAQLEILQQRLSGQEQARRKLTFLEAELTRIQEQVELIREQAALTTDPTALSQRIDQITETLGGTTQWIREQQQVYGQMEDLLVEPPAFPMPKATEEQKA